MRKHAKKHATWYVPWSRIAYRSLICAHFICRQCLHGKVTHASAFMKSRQMAQVATPSSPCVLFMSSTEACHMRRSISTSTYESAHSARLSARTGANNSIKSVKGIRGIVHVCLNFPSTVFFCFLKGQKKKGQTQGVRMVLMN